MVLYFVIVTGLIFGSCASAPKATAKPAPSYATLKIQELTTMEQDDPARAVEACASILDSSAGDSSGSQAPSIEDIRRLAASAELAVYNGYRTAVSAGDWNAAMGAFASLRAIAGDPELSNLLPHDAAAEAAKGDLHSAEIESKEAEAVFGKGLTAAALTLYIDSLDAGRDKDPSLSSDELQRWTSRALGARDRSSLAVLISLESSRGLQPPKDAAEYLASKDPISAMRKGVVTIDVDRGIKIEQGYGIPDRVLGSGFYIDRGGYLITNYHVISSEVDPKYRGYSRITVRPPDAPEVRLPAKVVGWDRLLDLALVKVDTTPDYVFSLARGNALAAGERILAIGSPAGLENTVTSGIVSAVGRHLLAIGDVFQLDAALNPGNSGGPVIDDAGKVEGVAFAGLPQFQGLNFAIPSSWLLRILPALFRGGEVKHAWLGLALAEDHAPPAEKNSDRLEVTYRHPSMAPGIEQGDFIDSIDGTKLDKLTDAQAFILSCSPKSLVLVAIGDAQGSRTLIRYLGDRPYAPIESAVAMDRKDKLFPVLYGMTVARLPSGSFGQTSYTITRIWPGTIADESGLSVDDPFQLRNFYVDDSQRAAFIQIQVEKRKAGFLESVIQLAATIDDPSFI
ncbi:MAG: S1C family serine protease [Rectinemataceae bacterium]